LDVAVRIGGLVLLLVLAGTGDAQAQEADTTNVVPVEEVTPAGPDPGETDRVLVNADSLSAKTRDGERVQELFRNVFVRQDTTRLESDYALRYLTRDELLFTDNVVIYERGDTLRADTVWYNKRTKVGRARGNVRMTDGDVTVRAPRATYDADEKRAVFPDSVALVDDDRVLRAQWGRYWSDNKRAEFKGRVRLTDPETYMEADSLTYYRDTERSVATGDVFVRRTGDGGAEAADSTDRTYLFGDWVDNQEQRRYSRVEGRALLIRVRMDTAGMPRDTLIVRAHRLDAQRSDSHRRLVAVDSVRTWQSDLAAVADSAVYDRVLEPGPVDMAATPRPPPETTNSPDRAEPTLAGIPDSLAVSAGPKPGREWGRSPADEDTTGPAPARDTLRTLRAEPEGATVDSVAPSGSSSTRPDSAARPDTARGEGARPSGRVAEVEWGRPTADSAEALPLEETRLFRSPVTWFETAQVWGDSIRVQAHDRSLDTVWVRGQAFAAQQDTSLDRIQQLKGRTLTAFFRADSLRRIRAWPNARAIRFLAQEDGALGGAARASGDEILLRFRDGAVRRVSVKGGVESTYYRKPAHIPDPFRLDGFQWTPERRPTKRDLLDEERVRRHLGRPSGERPVAGRPPERDTLPVRADDRSREHGTARSAARRAPPDTAASPPPLNIRRPPDDSVRVPSSPLPDTIRQSDPEP